MLTRRIWLAFALVSCGGCVAETPASVEVATPASDTNDQLYGTIGNEPFPIAALDLAKIDPRFRRQDVTYPTKEAPGTIVVDPDAHFLYLVEPGGKARRYGVAVGKEGLAWSGTATIQTKQEWPDWYPTPEMLVRRPDIKEMLTPLRSGPGIAGGSDNPIGARGMYLWQGNKDTLYRIHGTTEPCSIGTSASSGCIRMMNQDVIDLYGRVSIGTTVKVLPAKPQEHSTS